MATEDRMASSAAVAKIVLAKLHLPGEPAELLRGLSVEVPVDTEILNFSYSAHAPEVAQQRTEMFAQAYLPRVPPAEAEGRRARHPAFAPGPDQLPQRAARCSPEAGPHNPGVHLPGEVQLPSVARVPGEHDASPALAARLRFAARG